MIDRHPRRRRSRAGPIALAVLILIAAAAGFGLYVHVRSAAAAARRRSVQQATATATGWLRDWSTGRYTAMGLLAGSATVAPALSAEASGLHLVDALYRPGPLTVTGSTARMPFTAALQVGGLGGWSYHGLLPLRQTAHGWQVAFSPAVIYPGLRAGQRLVRLRTPEQRAQVEFANGTPMVGVDGELDANDVGQVAKLTAAQAKAAGSRFQAGDVGGLSGLERAFNTRLSGQPGGQIERVDAAGHVLAVLARYAPVPGQPVRTTFNLHDQRVAENALQGLGSIPGALVAIDVHTGAVLAMANHPIGGYPYAAVGRYPAGSTFKIVTTTAALAAGVSPSASLPCSPTITVDGLSFHNAGGEQLGPISFQQAFAVSCNTAFVHLETTLPAGAEAAAARLYGIGTSARAAGPLPYPSFGGSLPTPKDAAEAASDAIGQGRVLVSPLEMASIAAAVPAGAWRTPYVTLPRPATSQTHPLPAGAAAVLQQFMAAVVATGTAAQSGLPAGTYGKTGTAEYGSNTPPNTYAWFVGFRGAVAFACVAGGGSQSAGYGANTAAPAVARFLDGL